MSPAIVVEIRRKESKSFPIRALAGLTEVGHAEAGGASVGVSNLIKHQCIDQRMKVDLFALSQALAHRAGRSRTQSRGRLETQLPRILLSSPW